MLILRLWNYIRGYVIILVEGYFPEKFINVCINRGVYLWDVRREKSCVIILKTGMKAFARLRPIAKKTRCRIKVCSKKGLPFILHRYRRRKTFIIGSLLFIVMVYVLSSFIWTVEVFGNKKIASEEIIMALSETGLRVGMWKPLVDTEKVSNQLLLKVRELAWISIDISGTRAKVEIAERVMKPPIIEKDVPCNILAVKDGVIDTLNVKEGTPLIQVGSSVKKGDLIVAGMIQSIDGVVRYVHAFADIKARTWYEETCVVQTKRVKLCKTGKIKTKYSIMLFNKIIGVGSSRPPYGQYDKEQIVNQASLGKDRPLPFGIIINKYKEKKPANQTISVTDAKKEAANLLWERVKKKIPLEAKIKEKKVDYNVKGVSVKARILVECLEDISAEEKITY